MTKRKVKIGGKSAEEQSAIDKYLKTSGARSKTNEHGGHAGVVRPVAPNTAGGTNKSAWRTYRQELAALRRPKGIV